MAGTVRLAKRLAFRPLRGCLTAFFGQRPMPGDQDAEEAAGATHQPPPVRVPFAAYVDGSVPVSITTPSWSEAASLGKAQGVLPRPMTPPLASRLAL